MLSLTPPSPVTPRKRLEVPVELCRILFVLPLRVVLHPRGGLVFFHKSGFGENKYEFVLLAAFTLDSVS